MGAVRADAQGSGCPSKAPALSGPESVSIGASYSISWSNALGNAATSQDYYLVERSADPSFQTGVDRIRTTRVALTLTASLNGGGILFHRVSLSSSCVNPAAATFVSNVLAVRVGNGCSDPGLVDGLKATPSRPPALTTYVVSWDTGGVGQPGPGGAFPTGLRYRLRRTHQFETKESVSEGGQFTFSDQPGTYVYQVRAEAPCGTAGEWSTPIQVVVGDPPGATLVLVGDPKPLVIGKDAASPSTSFVVRNGGTAALNVAPVSTSSALRVEPAIVRLDPNASQVVTVYVDSKPLATRPLHARIQFALEAGRLDVPIDVAYAETAAARPVEWSDPLADVDVGANAILRSIVNRSASPAPLVSAIRAPWLTVESFDGQPWDRPLAPNESRVVRLVVDRTKRRAPTGTEEAPVQLYSAGFESTPQTLVVVDDGPRLLPEPDTDGTPTGPGPGGAPGVKPPATTLLYAALPNAPDRSGRSRFASDLWLTNLDAVSPVVVSVLLVPVGVSSASVLERRRLALELAPGETRRYRNIVGNVYGRDLSCRIEVSSNEPVLSSTAIVNSSPTAATLATWKAARAGAGGSAPAPTADAGAGIPQYGAEMRQAAPGEGVKASDPTWVLSGLSHTARRRTNILLTETSGYATTIYLSLYRSNGQPVLRPNGASFERVAFDVPAGGTLQVNDADLFGDATFSADQSPSAILQFPDPDDFGVQKGAVVPFATVIDDGTQDFALKVGVSQKNLDPFAGVSEANLKAGAAVNVATVPVAPVPLLLPVAHLRGAPLQDGSRPFWKTRVTLSNASDTEQRTMRLRFFDETGNVSRGSVFAVGLAPRSTYTAENILEQYAGVLPETAAFGVIAIEPVKNEDGTYADNWKDVDVQTETYTPDQSAAALGDYNTGMEAYNWRHGYSSYQSNLGTVQFEAAENSSRYRTNLILHEVTGTASATVAVTAYAPGSFVPIATSTVAIPAGGYRSAELFRQVLGLDRAELTNVRVVVRQTDGDGVFMAFASKINLATGDPANILLRPASAGTGR